MRLYPPHGEPPKIAWSLRSQTDLAKWSLVYGTAGEALSSSSTSASSSSFD